MKVVPSGKKIGAGKTHIGEPGTVGSTPNGFNQWLDPQLLHGAFRKFDDLHMGLNLFLHIVVFIPHI